MTKHMTMEEKLLYYNTPRTDAEEQIERLRDSKQWEDDFKTRKER